MKAKLFLVSFASLLMLLSCGQTDKGVTANDVNYDPDKLPIITWETKDFNFGTVKEGEVVKYSFKFKNTGKSNLIIADAATSCGCTVADKPEDPIQPGGEGQIDVEFNTSGKAGGEVEVKKNVTVISNTNPNRNILIIHGFVKK